VRSSPVIHQHLPALRRLSAGAAPPLSRRRPHRQSLAAAPAASAGAFLCAALAVSAFQGRDPRIEVIRVCCSVALNANDMPVASPLAASSASIAAKNACACGDLIERFSRITLHQNYSQPNHPACFPAHSLPQPYVVGCERLEDTCVGHVPAMPGGTGLSGYHLDGCMVR
jgi:hypothetical protein